MDRKKTKVALFRSEEEKRECYEIAKRLGMGEDFAYMFGMRTMEEKQKEADAYYYARETIKETTAQKGEDAISDQNIYNSEGKVLNYEAAKIDQAKELMSNVTQVQETQRKLDELDKIETYTTSQSMKLMKTIYFEQDKKLKLKKLVTKHSNRITDFENHETNGI